MTVWDSCVLACEEATQEFTDAETTHLAVFFLDASNTAPHFGQRIRSKSSLTISDGGMEYWHSGQSAFRCLKTSCKLTLFLCIGSS